MIVITWNTNKNHSSILNFETNNYLISSLHSALIECKIKQQQQPNSQKRGKLLSGSIFRVYLEQQQQEKSVQAIQNQTFYSFFFSNKKF